MNHVKTAAVGGLVLAAGLAAVLVNTRSHSPAETPAKAPAPEVARVAATPLSGSSRAITQMKDDRKVRDFVIKQVKDRFKAEGVTLEGKGSVTLKSQHTGGTISQRLIKAELVGKDGRSTRPLPLQDNYTTEASATEKRGSLIYRNLFEGLDVEYRYDGKDVEEFVHVSPALKQEITASGASLRLTALFPGLGSRNSFLETPATLVSDVEKKMADGNVSLATEDAELLVEGRHRFVLPAAIALDDADGRARLPRTARYTPEGMQVEMMLASNFVAGAQGNVVIDPSVLDGPRSVNLFTWNGPRAITKDDEGRFHVVYRAVHNGAWTAMYVNGDGNTWSAPAPVAAHTPGESTHYQPSIAIDGNGTIHVVYADHGSGDAANRGTADARHRMKYASCPERCRSGIWENHQFLLPIAGGHQYIYSLVVDGSNNVWVSFYDGDIGGVRILTNDGGGWVNQGLVFSSMSYSQLVVDNNGVVHMLGHSNGRNVATRHYFYDSGASTWVQLPNLTFANVNPTKAPLDISTVVDSANHIHVGITFLDYDVGFYRIGYARWNPVAQAWEDADWVDPAPSLEDRVPAITVDDNRTAHLMWQRTTTPHRIMYAQKPLGVAWTPSVPLFPVGPGQYHPHLRPRLAYPAYGNSIAPGLVDMVYIEDASIVKYFSTGSPVESAVLLRPADHSYTNSLAPTFEWRRLPSDSGSNTTYTLEIATTPLFDTILISKDVTTNSYTLTGTAPEQLTDGSYYYWRVRASNIHGSGPQSAIFELGVDTQPPSPFDLVAPANGSDPGTRTPTFQWTQSVN